MLETLPIIKDDYRLCYYFPKGQSKSILSYMTPGIGIDFRTQNATPRASQGLGLGDESGGWHHRSQWGDCPDWDRQTARAKGSHLRVDDLGSGSSQGQWLARLCVGLTVLPVTATHSLMSIRGTLAFDVSEFVKGFLLDCMNHLEFLGTVVFKHKRH